MSKSSVLTVGTFIPQKLKFSGPYWGSRTPFGKSVTKVLLFFDICERFLKKKYFVKSILLKQIFSPRNTTFY